MRGADEFGISFDNLRVDFGKAIDRSRKVVSRLTRGVEMLLRKNGVDLIEGEATMLDAGRSGSRRPAGPLPHPM